MHHSMPRRLRPVPIESRTSRLALSRRRALYGLVRLAPGIHLGYRRTTSAGTWVLRKADGEGGEWQARIGIADDIEDADGEHVLTFWQAGDKARAMARGTGSAPATFASALDSYEADLRARGDDLSNASRVRHHLTPTLASKPVALLKVAELRRWRDDLLASGVSPATLVRTLKSAAAALNLAANLDDRIRDRPWKVALSGIKNTFTPVSRVLPDEDVLKLVAGAYARDARFGLLIDVLASTGTRTSQACRLRVADLQDGATPRLMMPSSRKGRGRKESAHKPVPIPLSLAHKLKAAAGDRRGDAPLLTRADGAAWDPTRRELWTLFGDVARDCGLDVTAYSLRHSSIVRALLAGTPTRVVASPHDTSTLMLERTYSAFILDHADTVMRRRLLYTAQPAEGILSTYRGGGDDEEAAQTSALDPRAN
jgi:integrase